MGKLACSKFSTRLDRVSYSRSFATKLFALLTPAAPATQRSTPHFETNGFGRSPFLSHPTSTLHPTDSTTPFFSEGEGFVLVYSITARATFDRIERFRHQIARVKDSEEIPMVLVGNKSDRQSEREVSKQDGEQLAKRLNCMFIETSAKTRNNLEDAYYNVVRQSVFICTISAGCRDLRG